MNKLNGSYNDSESKIIPVKVHRAIQPFDPVNKILYNQNYIQITKVKEHFG